MRQTKMHIQFIKWLLDVTKPIWIHERIASKWLAVYYWLRPNAPCPICKYGGHKYGPKTLASLEAANRGEFDGSANSVEEMMEKLNARR